MSLAHQDPDGISWHDVSWDDPRVVALRALMDAEIKPRYADPEAFRDRDPMPEPRAEEFSAVWLAVSPEGEPVATAALRETPDGWEVKRVFVDARFRRRSLASRALSRVEESARLLGVRRLILETGSRQPEAQSLYRRQGWIRIPGYGPYRRDGFSYCYEKSV